MPILHRAQVVVGPAWRGSDMDCMPAFQEEHARQPVRVAVLRLHIASFNDSDEPPPRMAADLTAS